MINESENEVIKILQNVLKEDIGSGDITTECTIGSDEILCGKIIARESGVVAGLEVAKTALMLMDKTVKFDQFSLDGEFIHTGNTIARVVGKGRALLSSERVILNLIQRMSGIATITRQFVEQVNGTRTKILDTRKTVPGLRVFDKWAVRIGGGENHRFGLYDMVLIKDNHITAAGSITESVKRVKSRLSKELLIEVEVKNLHELHEALSLSIDRIMLDNMTISDIKKAVDMTNGRIPLEASGNVNLGNVKEIAETGVDYISVGMLTHSVKAFDISFIIGDSVENN